MDIKLKGKRALVTGSTAGIGFAIAKGLAEVGASVIINGRTKARVDAALVKLPGNVEGLAADLGMAQGVESAIAKYPEVEILVNNLGIFEPKPFEQITDEDWFRFFEVNVMSGVRLSRHYLPRMKQKNWGRIIFVSSESGVQIPSEMIQYGMTKTAQLAVSRGMAETTVGTGVTVNAVLPGPTASEGVSEFVDQLSKREGVDKQAFEKEFFTTMRPSSLLKRFATPEEVANIVTYLDSPLSSATNGAAVRVDGGVVRSIL
jgi:NAD(P)-dependent dehydrogenase (short-subunit alcohol dehydrogenase family)